MHLGKTGACDVLIFGSEVIYLLTIYVFSAGNCLPLVLLLNTAHVQQLQNPKSYLPAGNQAEELSATTNRPDITSDL